MYNELNGTYDLLFPSSLSSHSKIVKNISFDKIPGRAEHGQNMLARKVQKTGTSFILKPMNSIDRSIS